MNDLQSWRCANQNLIAKSISELSFEKVFQPTLIEDTKKSYELVLSSGVKYRFQGWMTIWDFIRVESQTIFRIENSETSIALNAGQFFIDAQQELEMNDIVLGNFLDEMYSTLFADQNLLKSNHTITAEEMTKWNGNKIQSFLNGHPKVLLNKGRMGWSASDLDQYAPENEANIQLHWIALPKKSTLFGSQSGWTTEKLALESLNLKDIEFIRHKLSHFGKTLEDSVLIPVHPWQWNRIIKIQYADELANQQMIDLGPLGDLYQPQISLRTLSNVTRPDKLDIKLPISVLNTSAVRGIPSRYINAAAQISEEIHQLCKEDLFLNQAKTEVLQEKAGVSYQHPLFKQIDQSPYRYQETLGAIWRESAEQKISGDEVAILSASLFHQDLLGNSLIGAYVKKSGLSIDQWLRRYFDVVVLPLYHLQLKYGLGLVAHGQNIVLKLKNYVPDGILLKDFQGDLRVSSEVEKYPLSSIFRNNLDHLPPHYLIHDLLTGHVITVLRFISATLQECDGFSENRFYEILSESIQSYHKLSHKYGAEIPTDPRISLLSPKISRVLLNKVRFRIGYADSSERPLPQLGPDLNNPISFRIQESP